MKNIIVLSGLVVFASCSHVSNPSRHIASGEKKEHIDVVLTKPGQYLVTVGSNVLEGNQPLVCGPESFITIEPTEVSGKTENNMLVLKSRFNPVELNWREVEGPIATIGYICETNTARGYFSVHNPTIVRIQFEKAADWMKPEIKIKKVK